MEIKNRGILLFSLFFSKTFSLFFPYECAIFMVKVIMFGFLVCVTVFFVIKIFNKQRQNEVYGPYKC